MAVLHLTHPDLYPLGSWQYMQNCAPLPAGSQMAALYFTTNGASTDMAVGTLPTLPVPVNYPQYGSMALLELEGPEYSTSVCPHRPWDPRRTLLGTIRSGRIYMG